MYDYKARMYSPSLGRFLQTDPIGYGDGPNWYAYVGNDPVNASDPSGNGKVDNNVPIGSRIPCQSPCSPAGTGLQTWGPGNPRPNELELLKRTDPRMYALLLKARENYLTRTGDVNGDGKLSLSEANNHRRDGSGSPLLIDATKLTVLLSGNTPEIGESVGGYVAGISGFLVFGNVYLTRTGESTYTIKSEMYDFDFKDWDSASHIARNIENYFGKKLSGPGVDFETRFRGSPRVIPRGCQHGAAWVRC